MIIIVERFSEVSNEALVEAQVSFCYVQASQISMKSPDFFRYSLGVSKSTLRHRRFVESPFKSNKDYEQVSKIDLTVSVEQHCSNSNNTVQTVSICFTAMVNSFDSKKAIHEIFSLNCERVIQRYDKGAWKWFLKRSYGFRIFFVL